MRRLFLTLVLMLLTLGTEAREIHLLFIRHGEKPKAGLGQLNCQGWQRALRLADVLIPLRGRPTALFAPNPGVYKNDQGTAYAYIRPLATLEPSAIRLGLPVQLDSSFSEVNKLTDRLLALPDHSVAWIAWEHHQLVAIERTLLHNADNPVIIPDWDSRDFDRVDLLDLVEQGGHWTVRYQRAGEFLNQLPSTCSLDLHHHD